MSSPAPVSQAVLRDIAQETRDAIAHLDCTGHRACRRIRSILCSTEPFPAKWCKFASMVLGRRIARMTERTDIVLCTWNREESLADHWWLRLDDIDIDITADQFDFTAPSVVVEKKSELHRTIFPNESKSLLFLKPMNICFERAILSLDHAVSEKLQRADPIAANLEEIGYGE